MPANMTTILVKTKTKNLFYVSDVITINVLSCCACGSVLLGGLLWALYIFGNAGIATFQKKVNFYVYM